MRLPSLLAALLLTACFGSLSPDRSPTGLGPEVPGPPPPSPTPPPPPPVAIAELKVAVPATLSIGGQAQVSITALDERGRIVSHAALPLQFWSRNPAVFTVSSAGLLTGVKKGNALVHVSGGGFTVDKMVQVVD